MLDSRAGKSEHNPQTQCRNQDSNYQAPLHLPRWHLHETNWDENLVQAPGGASSFLGMGGNISLQLWVAKLSSQCRLGIHQRGQQLWLQKSSESLTHEAAMTTVSSCCSFVARCGICFWKLSLKSVSPVPPMIL